MNIFVSCLLFAVLIPVAYFILMVIVRWHAIAVPIRRLAFAQIKGLRERWKQELTWPSLQDAKEQALDKQIEELLNQAEAALNVSFYDKLFWPRGAELKAWRLIHDAESLIALGMDKELAREKLAQIQAEEAPKNKSSKQSKSEEDKDIRKKLYCELRQYYDRKDSNFARLSAMHAKISWLVYVGLLLVGIFLALGQNRMQELPSWMLFGALGALLSRCLRFLKATQLPTEYGFYWILLFLGPIYGALAGIASVLLLHLLIEIKILSSEIFGSFLLNQEAGMYNRLALATLTGLSERWLDKLVKQGEEKVLLALQKEKEGIKEESNQQTSGESEKIISQQETKNI